MNTVIIRKVTLGTTFQPVAAERTVGVFTIRSAGNAVILLSDDGITEVALSKSQQFTLNGVDLATIQAKGAAGDTLVVIGATRTA